MTQKIIMIYGAPATGKTTLARFLLGSMENVVYASRDLIRKSVPAHRTGDFAYDREVCQRLISDSLSKGQSVIIDNVNLSPKDFDFVTECSIKYNVPVHLITRQVPLKTALERNAKRKDKAPIPPSYIIDTHDDQYKLTRSQCRARGVVYDIEKPYYHFVGISATE